MNTEHTNQSSQAEQVNQQLLDALEQLVRVVKLQRPWGASVHKAEKAIAAAAQAQAEPVELRSVFDEMFDYSVDPTDDVSREWLWRFSKGLVGRLSSKQPAVAVPEWLTFDRLVNSLAIFVYGATQNPLRDQLTPDHWENTLNDMASQSGMFNAMAAVRAMLAAAPQATAEDSSLVQAGVAVPAEWPTAQDVGRIGDMSQVAGLRVGLDADNDVYVCIHGEAGSGSVEFCVPGSGGGKSPRTRTALISLMVAMEADNAETPSRDWWKAREGDAQKGGAA